MNFFVISLFLKIAIERLTKYFSNFFVVLIFFFTAFSSSISLISVLFFFRCLLLLLLKWELWYLYSNSKVRRNDVVFRWFFVILFDKFCNVFENCEIKHWIYIICFFKSFHFFLFYWTHVRLCLMLCFFAIDVFMRDFYFVFTTSIRIMSFCTMIVFLDIWIQMFDINAKVHIKIFDILMHSI